ncbi:tRNA dimethylallyltransferase [Hylemonella gracilis str. Niagara R]|uniref:tRNA dimethylallyltransferase n=1 Tax=Hylemonella gracilis str. Niagara R TaxID=1458275 RepID=A0A016XJI1_9BURK|nr:tRNA (adenosine(37)-N6)-dimethylallyltransferase MiaA [Hylemonella gracilis]EYC52025.1 tRNA dimethylallyltransferase [Hylemonella gracilis str. Niagara R]
MSARPSGPPPNTPPAAPLPPALAIVGPTASGKTAAALAIAQAFPTPTRAGTRPVEIISADSALVYRGMDIGTAKPDAAERAIAPHHLIDIRDPSESYSAAEFVRDATRLIHEIHARGHLPLLVGGTLLYIKALLEGLDDLPPADATVRAALDAEARALGWAALHTELQRVDPVTAMRLPPGDTQRIQRALEVYRLTGRPLSSFHTRATNGTSSPHAPALTLIALEPQDRVWLHAGIARRFDAMLQAGLLDEVRALRARGDLHADLPSMRCVGYRQAWEFLDAQEAQGTPVAQETGRDTMAAARLAPSGQRDAPTKRGAPQTDPLDELRERGIAATRQLAKRQITWLRGLAQADLVRHQVACDAPDAQIRVLDLARQFAATHYDTQASMEGRST